MKPVLQQIIIGFADSDEESEEESSDDEDWSESDDESGSEGGGYDLDICPPGCDQALYNNTTQLREKRLDIEEVICLAMTLLWLYKSYKCKFSFQNRANWCHFYLVLFFNHVD